MSYAQLIKNKKYNSRNYQQQNNRYRHKNKLCYNDIMNKLELKTKAWAKEYIKNNFNGTQTALEMASKNKLMKRETAKAIASENLTKPIYQNAIIEEMEEIGLNNDFINKITKRNIKQGTNISASNQAVDMFHKIKGNYAPEKRITANISLTGKALDEAIQDKINELESL